MKTLVLLCLGIAFAAEAPPKSGLYRIHDRVQSVAKMHQTGHEYTYYYDAQVMTGLPRTSAQRSGSRIQCAVLVYPQTNNMYVVKLEHVSIGSIDQRIPFSSQNRILPMDMFDPATINQVDKAELEQPIVVKRMNGMIVELKMKQQEQPWVKNVKRGILNMLSVDLKGANRVIKSKYCQNMGTKDCAAEAAKELANSAEFDFYSKPEVTVEGNCEVEYTVVPYSGGAQKRWNITKAIDLSRCHGQRGSNIRRPQVAYNFHLTDACPGCETQGKAMNATTYITYDCMGEAREQCAIERAQSVSVYSVPSLTDEPGNTIRTKVNQTLILVDYVQKGAPSAGGLAAERTGLEYSMDWDKVKEEFQMFGKEGPWKNMKEYAKWGKNKVAVCKKILKDLANDMKADIKTAPLRMDASEGFAQLVRVMRGMTEAEFDQLHNQAFASNVGDVNPKNAKAVKDILHSAVAAAGTLPALKHTKKCIEENKLTKPIRVVSTLKQLQGARIVSKKMTETMEQLCDGLEDKPFQYQVCLLSWGSMIRTRCQPAKNVLAIQQTGPQPDKCNAAERKAIVEKLQGKLSAEAGSFARNIAIVKCLANTGLTEMAPVIKKVATNFEYSEELRTQAVLALRTLKEVAPKFISATCLPIALDKRMEPSVRVACAHVVLSSNPQVPELLALVSQVNQPSDSRIVKSFIYSEISSLANSTGSMYNPCTKQVAHRARQVLRLINDNEKVLSRSFSSRMPLYSNKQPYGMELLLQSLGSNSSFIPSVMAAQIGSSFMGFNVPEVLSLAVQSKGVDKVLVKLMKEGLSGGRTRGARSALNDQLRQKLAEMQNNEQAFNADDARLVAYLRIMGQEAGALPLTKSIFEWLKEQYKGMTNAELKQEFSIHLASIYYERLFKIPTAMGLPIIVRTELPIVFQAKGSLGEHNTNTHYLKDMRFRPTVVAQQEVTVEVWSPVVNSGAKVSQRIRISPPVAAKVTKQGQLEIEMPRESSDIITVTSEPRLFRRKWYEAGENKYVHAVGQMVTSEHHARVHKEHNRKLKIFGMQFELSYWYSKSHLESYANFPFVLPTAGPSGMILSLEPVQGCNVMKIKPRYQSTRMESGELKSRVHSIHLGETPAQPEFKAKQHSKKELTIEAECGSISGKARFVYKTSPGNRLRRTKVEVFPAKGSNRPSYCFETEVLYPSGPIKANDLNSDIKSRMVYSWDGNCRGNSKDNRVTLEMQSELSEQKKDFVQKRSRDFRHCQAENSPVECYHILAEAQKPDRHTLAVTYKKDQIKQNVKNYLQTLLAQFSASHIMNAEINKYANNKEDEIKIRVNVDPVTHAQQNITLHEPGQTIRYRDIRTSLLPSPNAMFMRLVRPSTYMAQCLVSDRIIKNFDGVNFRAPVTDCWTVLAKDCTPANRFAVLLRKKAANSNVKVLGIVTPSKLIELSKEADFVLTIDGQVKPVPPPTEQMKEMTSGIFIQKYDDKKIKIALPEQELAIYFDGKAVSIKLSATYFSEQCGLCGHYNMDESDTFRTKAFQTSESVLDFFKSYQIVKDGCAEPTNTNQYHLGGQPVTTDQQNQFKLNRGSSTPIQRRRGAYRSGRYCISKDNVKTCPLGSTPADITEETKQFACLASHHDAHTYARMVSEQQEIPSIPSGEDVEFNEQISVSIPARCVYH